MIPSVENIYSCWKEYHLVPAINSILDYFTDDAMIEFVKYGKKQIDIDIQDSKWRNKLFKRYNKCFGKPTIENVTAECKSSIELFAVMLHAIRRIKMQYPDIDYIKWENDFCKEIRWRDCLEMRPEIIHYNEIELQVLESDTNNMNTIYPFVDANNYVICNEDIVIRKFKYLCCKRCAKELNAITEPRIYKIEEIERKYLFIV